MQATANLPLLSASGSQAVVYLNEAGTQVATDLLDANGSPVTDGTFVLDSLSRMPQFDGPTSGAATLYIRVDGGAPLPIHATVTSRIDAQTLLVLETLAESTLLASRYGVTNDGTDCTAALNALFAIASGRTVLMPGGDVTISGKVSILADDVKVQWAGTRLVAPAMNVFAVAVEGDRVSFLDTFRLLVTSGSDSAGITISGDYGTYAALDVAATVDGAGSNGNGLNEGVRVAGLHNTFGLIAVENFRYSLSLRGATSCTVQRVRIKKYIRGIYVRDGQDVHFLGGTIDQPSSFATPNAGNNGTLLDNSVDYGTDGVYFQDILVDGAGEHAHRIGGGNLIARNVRYTRCTVRNAGGSAFKALGDPAKHHDSIYYTDCVAVDSGTTNENHNGFQVQNCDNVYIVNAKVRKRNNTYSARHGIYVSGCNSVQVTNPDISNVFANGYFVESVQGASSNVELRGGRIFDSGSRNIKIDAGDVVYGGVTYPGVTFTNVSVYGTTVDASRGWQVQYVGSSASGTLTRCVLDCVMTGTTDFTKILQGDSDVIFGRVWGDFISTSTLANGSIWQDRNNGIAKVRAAGAWAAAS